jgi:Na+-driven multidrug efflux pump
MAADRQRAWSVAQSLCVIASFVLDPIFIPWFQHRYGNGGLGVCVASVASEALMLLAGLLLIPRGILDRRLGRSILLALLAGTAMAAVAFAARRLSPFLGAPLAAGAYLGTLLLTGAIDKDQLAGIRSMVARKLRLSETPPT